MTEKVDRAMLLVGIAWGSVQLCSLVVDYGWGSGERNMFGRSDEPGLARLAVYWGVGFVAMTLACVSWSRQPLSRCLAVSGTLLMLLGGHGGFFGSQELLPHRIAVTAVTLGGLVVIAWRMSKGTHGRRAAARSEGMR